ncbi:MAG: hypothetical protein ACFB22_03135 [Rhodothalassiaceae bacterium]
MTIVPFRTAPQQRLFAVDGGTRTKALLGRLSESAVQIDHEAAATGPEPLLILGLDHDEAGCADEGPLTQQALAALRARLAHTAGRACLIVVGAPRPGLIGGDLIPQIERATRREVGGDLDLAVIGAADSAVTIERGMASLFVAASSDHALDRTSFLLDAAGLDAAPVTFTQLEYAVLSLRLRRACERAITLDLLALATAQGIAPGRLSALFTPEDVLGEDLLGDLDPAALAPRAKAPDRLMPLIGFLRGEKAAAAACFGG